MRLALWSMTFKSLSNFETDFLDFFQRFFYVLKNGLYRFTVKISQNDWRDQKELKRILVPEKARTKHLGICVVGVSVSQTAALPLIGFFQRF